MEFHLDEEMFKIVKSGTKHIEVRLNDEKRKNLKSGSDDTLFATCDGIVKYERLGKDKNKLVVIQ